MLNKTIIGLICMWMFYANAENNLTMRILSYETDQVEILDGQGQEWDVDMDASNGEVLEHKQDN